LWYPILKVVGQVLHFFNASPDNYKVIFTANASAALKLVGESYPFGKYWQGCLFTGTQLCF
jgi:selenocysteine lyase/cysteine desulfurase